MKIVRTTLFARCLKKLEASDAEVAALELEIASNPLAGDVIPGMRGIRKLRFAMGGKGKRGGGRAIYFVVLRDETAFLLMAYAKSVQENLSTRQREALLRLVEEILR